jgi:hypothetical protein
MNGLEFINSVCPEHGRTSCSDKNVFNGFSIDEDGSINKKYAPRCIRCAFLEIENKTVEINEANKAVIIELLNL